MRWFKGNSCSILQAWAVAASLTVGFSCAVADGSSADSRYPMPPDVHVLDLAHVLTPSEVRQVERMLDAAERTDGFEVAVVTLRSIRDFPGTDNDSIEAFAGGLFDSWGIGKLPANKGALLLVAVGDREARIELGAGFDGASQTAARRIVARRIVPHFRNERFGRGIVSGVEGILNAFGPPEGSLPWLGILLGVGLIPVGLVVASLIRKGRHGWGWVVAGMALIVLVFLLWALKMILLGLVALTRLGLDSQYRSWLWGGHRDDGFFGGSRGWFSGGFSSGSSSGSSWGGGFSGGGGATGRW